MIRTENGEPTIAIATLLFSYFVEVLQYFNIVEKLGLQNSKLARIIIGTNFSWLDMLSYTIGIVLVLLIEKNPLHFLFLILLPTTSTMNFTALGGKGETQLTFISQREYFEAAL